MKPHNLILTVGIPGAGKTTWAREYQRRCPNTAIVSSDDMRFMLTGTTQCDPEQSSYIHQKTREKVAELLDKQDVIVDSTNTSVDEWIAYKRLYPYLFIAKVFDTPPEKAYIQQQHRERQVPYDVLEMKWNEFQKSKEMLDKVFNFIL